MAAPRRLIGGALLVAALVACAFLLWRYVWFFRDPPRTPPAQPGLVSPADGTVVYVRTVVPGDTVVSIKQGVEAKVADILRADVARTKLVIGIFMSPFDVHYNRAPLDARVEFIRRHPAIGENMHMGAMHWRTLLNLTPHYAGSVHIVQNERAVTRFVGTYRDAPLPFYVVQIGARTVNGIDSYVRPGDHVARGQTFGMIRIGSQVDLIVTWREGLEVLVRSGANVRAGETLLVQ
jgi:phosphatidylserine decarboxylase